MTTTEQPSPSKPPRLSARTRWYTAFAVGAVLLLGTYAAAWTAYGWDGVLLVQLLGGVLCLTVSAANSLRPGASAVVALLVALVPVIGPLAISPFVVMEVLDALGLAPKPDIEWGVVEQDGLYVVVSCDRSLPFVGAFPVAAYTTEARARADAMEKAGLLSGHVVDGPYPETVDISRERLGALLKA